MNERNEKKELDGSSGPEVDAHKKNRKKKEKEAHTPNRKKQFFVMGNCLFDAICGVEKLLQIVFAMTYTTSAIRLWPPTIQCPQYELGVVRGSQGWLGVVRDC